MPIQRKLSLAALSLGATLAAALTGCGDTTATTAQGGNVDTTASTGAAAPEVAPAVADPAKALVRSASRWDHKVSGDWIQVYDFVLPDLRRGQGLGQFLSGKEYHVYENPTQPLLLGVRDNLAFVEVTALWTPMHPQVLAANNLESPEELRQELAVIETWMFAKGEWYWVKEQRQSEFFEENPDIVPGGK